MNHAPRFRIGEEVITATHGAGVVKWIYPAEHARRHLRYSVQVAGQPQALVLYEEELRARAGNDPTPPVRCMDCANNPRPLARAVILCPTLNKYRRTRQLRPCARFAPRADSTATLEA